MECVVANIEESKSYFWEEFSLEGLESQGIRGLGAIP